MLVKSVDEALALIKEETAFPLNGKIELGSGFVLQIKIPNPPVNSSITPAFMEAFLELQRQIYQLSALQRKGVANAIYLSEDDKRDLDISVIVKDGSSVFDVNLGEGFKALLDDVVGKMSGTEVTITVIILAILLAAGWSFKTYLSYRKDIKLKELDGEDHKQALEAISSVEAEEAKKYEMLTEVLKQNGEFGRKALEVLETTNEALVKAAAKTDETIINGVLLDKNQAKTLQTSARTRAEEIKLTLQVRVIDINTQDQIAVSMTIRDIENENDYKLVFPKGIVSSDDCESFFKALETRASLWVELDAKIREDTIRSVEFRKLLKSE